MNYIDSPKSIWIFMSFLLAFCLSLLPLPNWVDWLRPEWLLLVTIYWILALPNKISVGIAWFIGILVDVLNGTLLGEHALAFVIVAYFVARLYLRIRVASLWQQAITVLILVLLYQLLLFIIQGLIGDAPQVLWYWLTSLTSMLCWPWIFIMLRDWRRRLKITI